VVQQQERNYSHQEEQFLTPDLAADCNDSITYTIYIYCYLLFSSTQPKHVADTTVLHWRLNTKSAQEPLSTQRNKKLNYHLQVTLSIR